MLSKFLNRLTPSYRSSLTNLMVSLCWVALGVVLVLAARTDAGSQHYTLLSGCGLLITGLGIGAVVDVSIFEDWDCAATQRKPLEQYRRMVMMTGCANVMAILMWLWGRL